MLNKDQGFRKYSQVPQYDDGVRLPGNGITQPHTDDARMVPEHMRDNAFGVVEPTTNTPASGVQNIDALLNGVEWQNLNVTYSLTDNYANDYEAGYPGAATHSTSFQRLNGTQEASTRDWMRNYEQVSNLNPTELAGASDRDATIRLASSDDPYTAYAYYPQGHVAGGDIWIGQTFDYTNPQVGTYSNHTFGHEIGHAVGLKHGQETGGVGNTALSYDRDSMEFSIMTYRSYIGDSINDGYNNSSGSYAQSLMMYDIAAVQHMYGVQYDNVNTNYTFSNTTGEMFVNGVGEGIPYTNTIFRTVWDNGGTDTYDYSNYTTRLSIDLAPGGWSDVDTQSNFQTAHLGNGNYSRGNVFNALKYNNDDRSLIENANGGSNDDTIKGNDANNSINGNNGNDTLYGLAGHDTLTGWTGSDTMIGNIGDDTYYVENASDQVIEQFNEGYDTVYSKVTHTLSTEVEALFLTGDGAINGTGNGLANYIVGNNGANTINGGIGQDTVMGEGGNDTLIGWNDADLMYGGTGNDKFSVENINDRTIEYAGEGIDTTESKINHTLELNIEHLTLTGTAAINGIGNSLGNTMKGNGYVNTLNGLTGNDILDGQLGKDILAGGGGSDKFRFTTKGNTTTDKINDYNVADDTIQLENAVFTKLTTVGTLNAANFRVGTAAADANDFVIYNKTAGKLLYDADGNAGGAAVEVATLATGLAMTNADIFVL